MRNTIYKLCIDSFINSQECCLKTSSAFNFTDMAFERKFFPLKQTSLEKLTSAPLFRIKLSIREGFFWKSFLNIVPFILLKILWNCREFSWDPFIHCLRKPRIRKNFALRFIKVMIGVTIIFQTFFPKVFRATKTESFFICLFVTCNPPNLVKTIQKFHVYWTVWIVRCLRP